MPARPPDAARRAGGAGAPRAGWPLVRLAFFVLVAAVGGRYGYHRDELYFRDATGLPPVVSGHNAYGWWGPPPPSATRVLVVGRFEDRQLRAWFTACRPVTVVRNTAGVDDDEDGVPARQPPRPRRNASATGTATRPPL